MNLRDKLQAVLLAIILGDALGQPVETMTAEAILAATGGVTGFIEPIQTVVDPDRELHIGDTTDDWQLARIVAEALIDVGGYDQFHMARAHVRALRDTTVGWGGTTRDAVRELEDWFAIKDGGRSPLTPASFSIPNRGGGNGVAMKIAPLAALHACRAESDYRELLDDTIQLFELTHTHPTALYTAYAYSLLMMQLLRLPKPLVAAQTKAQRWETDTLLAQLMASLRTAHYWVDGLEDPTATVQQLHRVRGMVGDAEALRTEITPGFSAITSVPYVIGLFLTYPTDYETAVLTAVNAGLDSDSTAAMVGALVAANCGSQVIPTEWRDFRPWYWTEAANLGDQLYEVAVTPPTMMRTKESA
jgi:ADP-ribosylglycohydrolase